MPAPEAGCGLRLPNLSLPVGKLCIGPPEHSRIQSIARFLVAIAGACRIWRSWRGSCSTARWFRCRLLPWRSMLRPGFFRSPRPARGIRTEEQKVKAWHVREWYRDSSVSASDPAASVPNLRPRNIAVHHRYRPCPGGLVQVAAATPPASVTRSTALPRTAAVIFTYGGRQKIPRLERRGQGLQGRHHRGRVEGRPKPSTSRCIESFASGIVINAPALRRGKQTLQHCLSQRNTLVLRGFAGCITITK